MRAPQPCSGCRKPSQSGTCTDCRRLQANARDRLRPSSSERGYTGAHHTFRRLVLARDPWCTCPGCPSCAQHPCLRDSTDADHHPLTRSELVASGRDPNDPAAGRGLCHQCHAHHTATSTGWHA